MLWRRFSAFVTCKNCRGRPIATSKGFANSSASSTVPREGDEEVSGPDCLLNERTLFSSSHIMQFFAVWSVGRGTTQSKKDAKRTDAIEQEWCAISTSLTEESLAS